MFTAQRKVPNWTTVPKTETKNGEELLMSDINDALVETMLCCTLLCVIHYDLTFSASLPAEPKDSNEGEMTLITNNVKYLFTCISVIVSNTMKANATVSV